MIKAIFVILILACLFALSVVNMAKSQEVNREIESLQLEMGDGTNTDSGADKD